MTTSTLRARNTNAPVRTATLGAAPNLNAILSSRESRVGAALDSNGRGTGGNGAVLKQGASGPEVRALQNQLTLLGYNVGTVDGQFGPNTGAAVKKFQADKGLATDGVVGPKTQDALKKASAPASRDSFAPSGAQWIAAPSLDEVLKKGKLLKLRMQGPAVERLQKQLGLPSHEVDGKFGPATQAAVKSFQKANKLTPPPGLEGVVGKTTLEQLQKPKAGSTGARDISAWGREQMNKLLAYAKSHNTGASRGRCFEFVWKYMTNTGYGKIRNYKDAADMPSTFARNFAEYMNSNGNANAKRWGLRKLDIPNPYDAPPGAIVVVAPGTPGTAHPTAGDIAIAAGGGRFINDGPNMGYGDPARFLRDGGRVLGVYVPA